MQPIRSYVVRIYRRHSDHVDGVVEDVKTGQSRPFHSPADLWQALRGPWRRASAGAKRGSGNPPQHD